jgi:SET domain-containing protein
VLEDVKSGQFIIEYVGEVVSNDECLQRLSKDENMQHFYILTIDSNECIDALRKGNLARFINHSCNPNCQTQKWYCSYALINMCDMYDRYVAGETCVGIFAITDIKAGTELTFDYQFERFGSQKQICYCGEANCRGYLGAKPKPSSKVDT